MKKNIITVMFIILMIISCSKKKETDKTSEEPIVQRVKSENVFKPQLKFSVDLIAITDSTKAFDSNRTEICLDSDDNVYIMDNLSNTMKKYNSEGKQQAAYKSRYFFRAGGDVFFRNGKLYAASPKHQEIQTFDTELNYIKSYYHNYKVKPMDPVVVNDTTMVSSFYRPRKEGDDMQLYISLSISDTLYNKRTTVAEVKHLFDPLTTDQLDLYIHYTASQNKIYFPDKSSEHYKIFVFDTKGKLLNEIDRKYTRKKLKQWEKDKYMEFMNAFYPDNPYKQLNARFKKAVNFIQFDKHDEILWAAPSLNRKNKNDTDLILDLYKQERFYKRIKLDIGKSWYDMNFNNFRLLIGKGNFFVQDFKENKLYVYDKIKL